MANYRLVTNAEFKPFTFEDYIKPYQIYGEAYKELETNISDLELQAGKWEKLANEQTDPETHATYLAYANELKALAEELASHGITPDLRKRIVTMKGRYAKEIEPIETLYNRREVLRLEQRQADALAHGTAMFDNDYSRMSLDEMLRNPDMSYRMVTGENITAEVVARLLAKANELGERIAYENAGITGSDGASLLLNAVKTRGLTLDLVMKVINGDPDAEPFLASIYDDMAKMYEDNPAYTREKAKRYIDKGLLSLVGGKEVNPMEDPRAAYNYRIKRDKVADAQWEKLFTLQLQTFQFDKEKFLWQKEQARIQDQKDDAARKESANQWAISNGLVRLGNGQYRAMTQSERQQYGIASPKPEYGNGVKVLYRGSEGELSANNPFYAEIKKDEVAAGHIYNFSDMTGEAQQRVARVLSDKYGSNANVYDFTFVEVQNGKQKYIWCIPRGYYAGEVQTNATTR